MTDKTQRSPDHIAEVGKKPQPLSQTEQLPDPVVRECLTADGVRVSREDLNTALGVTRLASTLRTSQNDRDAIDRLKAALSAPQTEAGEKGDSELWMRLVHALNDRGYLQYKPVVTTDDIMEAFESLSPSPIGDGDTGEARDIQFRPVATGHIAWEVIRGDCAIGEIIQWRLDPPSFTLKLPFDSLDDAQSAAHEWLKPLNEMKRETR